MKTIFSQGVDQSEFFRITFIAELAEGEETCPCCGGHELKDTGNRIYRCRRVMDCPLANVGGYFYTDLKVTIIEFNKQRYYPETEEHRQELVLWAKSYRREHSSISAEVGDIGIIVNSQHSWNNGIKVKIIGKEEDQEGEEYLSAESLEPDIPAMFFLKSTDIIEQDLLDHFDSQRAIGKVVTMTGKPSQSPTNPSGLTTNGKQVKIMHYVTSIGAPNSPYWVGESLQPEAHSGYLLGLENFRKLNQI